MLFSQAELQAFISLLNRIGLNSAEQQFVQMFINRLVAFCQPPKPETPPEADSAEAD